MPSEIVLLSLIFFSVPVSSCARAKKVRVSSRKQSANRIVAPESMSTFKNYCTSLMRARHIPLLNPLRVCYRIDLFRRRCCETTCRTTSRQPEM